MYAQTTIHGIILLTCVLFYFLSPEKGIKVSVQEVSAKEIRTETGTIQAGVGAQVQGEGKETEVKENVGGVRQDTCDVDCKVKTLIDIGIDDRIAGSLVYTCKDKAIDPVHCIIAGASVVKNESSGGKRCKNNNCMGVGGVRIAFSSVEKGVEDWIARYNKYWYKAKSASFFYPPKGQVSRSRYCTSESSSNSSIGCPNGLRIAQGVWDKLTILF